MKLGEIVATYLNENGISYEQFSKRSGFSRGYVSMLVNSNNPNTDKEISPTINTFTRLAEAMDMTIEQLFNKMNDMPISDSDLVLRPSEIKLLRAYRAADESARKFAYQMLENNPAAIDVEKERLA